MIAKCRSHHHSSPFIPFAFKIISCSNSIHFSCFTVTVRLLRLLPQNCVFLTVTPWSENTVSSCFFSLSDRKFHYCANWRRIWWKITEYTVYFWDGTRVVVVFIFFRWYTTYICDSVVIICTFFVYLHNHNLIGRWCLCLPTSTSIFMNAKYSGINTMVSKNKVIKSIIHFDIFYVKVRNFIYRRQNLHRIEQLPLYAGLRKISLLQCCRFRFNSKEL